VSDTPLPLPFDLGKLTHKLRHSSVMPPLNIRQAEVTENNSDGTCKIKLAGSTIELDGVLSFIPVVAGDIVWVFQQGTSLVVFDHIDTGWHEVGAGGEPAFQNSWVNVGGSYQTVAFRKVGGIVHLKGSAKSGNSGNAVYTLPVGFRPVLDVRAGASAFDGGAFLHALLYVTPAGAVAVHVAAGHTNPIEEIHIHGSFVAEQ
jgi:hypothetical protein